LREVELLVEAGFHASEAIKIASFNGATLLGEDARIGSIAVGKQADLMIVRGNPALNISEILKVEIVFMDGVGYDSEKLIQSLASLLCNRGLKQSSDLSDTLSSVIPKSALPDPNRSKPALVEFYLDPSITLLIPGDFSCPIVNIRFRDTTTEVTAMPEAAVHENRDLFGRKYEIWFAG
jgi:hypothetical protein